MEDVNWHLALTVPVNSRCKYVNTIQKAYDFDHVSVVPFPDMQISYASPGPLEWSSVRIEDLRVREIGTGLWCRLGGRVMVDGLF